MKLGQPSIKRSDRLARRVSPDSTVSVTGARPEDPIARVPAGVRSITSAYGPEKSLGCGSDRMAARELPGIIGLKNPYSLAEVQNSTEEWPSESIQSKERGCKRAKADTQHEFARGRLDTSHRPDQRFCQPFRDYCGFRRMMMDAAQWVRKESLHRGGIHTCTPIHNFRLSIRGRMGWRKVS